MLRAIGQPSTPLASPSSPSAIPSSDDAIVVIRVTERIVQEANLDLGEPGDSLGDQFSNDLFRAGEKGRYRRRCLHARALEADGVGQSAMHGDREAAYRSDHGSGLAMFSDGPSTFKLPVIGGTGRFREARGVLIVESST